MNSFADKIQENQKSLKVTQKRNNNSVSSEFSNQRPATVAQMQLQEIANNSEQVKQAMQLQAMVNAKATLPIQKKGIEEEELQMKAAPVQRKGIEEEESIQMKASPIQKQNIEEEESLQGKFALPVQKKENNTGLPDDLKSGIENLSGFPMNDVKVHYNSDKPAQLQAHAYAQGTDIHIASGQEKHLPHEAWHVVQQKQGRVQPTLQMKGNVNVNDDDGLEREADVMGGRALQVVDNQHKANYQNKLDEYSKMSVATIQNDTTQRAVRIGGKRMKSAKDIRQQWRAAYNSGQHIELDDSSKEIFHKDLTRLAEGKNETPFADWKEAYTILSQPKVLVTGSDGSVSIIRTTNDLMAWVGSYPLTSSDYVELGTVTDATVLKATLDLLITTKRKITTSKVWQAIIKAKNGEKPKKDPKIDWGEMDTAETYDLIGIKSDEGVPARFRRKLRPQDRADKLEEIKASLEGYKLVGLHATDMERMTSLVQTGINTKMFGKGHGIGKGNGFYIIPTPPKKQISTILKSAKAWGSHVVAVFLPNSVELESAHDGENVQTLESNKKPSEQFYYGFGMGEAVIPPSLCKSVKFIIDPADVAVAVIGPEVESYNQEMDFLKELK
jgi:hypothetical protein